MSLFRKIRRRHKAFVLKRSAQKLCDNAASVFPVDDGEVEDEDEAGDFMVDFPQPADEQNGDVSAGHEIHKLPSRTEHLPLQAGISGPPSGNEVGLCMQIGGKEGRFWFRVAKIAVFLFITTGYFCVGKVAAVGITLTVASAFKLFARDRIISVEAEQSRRSNESLPLRTDVVGPSSVEMAKIDGKAPLVDESNGAVQLIGSGLVRDTVGRRQESLQGQDEAALDFKTSGDSLLAQGRKLKRLNCIKKTPATSPFVEILQDSPSLSRASPRLCFRNLRNSTPTGKGMEASYPEVDCQEKLKSKILLMHLRRKGEPLSAPSSPLSSCQEGSSNICFATSDGSDTERPSHRMTPACRRSKFLLASPAKEGNASMGLPDKDIFCTLLARKGEKTLSPSTSLASEAMATDVPNAAMKKLEKEASSCMPVGQNCLTTEVHMSASSQALETMQSTSTPGNPPLRDVLMIVDSHSPLSSTHELSHQTKQMRISSRKPVTLAAQEGSTTKAVMLMNQYSVSERGEMQRKLVRVGYPWVAAGFMIMLAGLFVGRMTAVTGLVCYWYSLSLRKGKV